MSQDRRHEDHQQQLLFWCCERFFKFFCHTVKPFTRQIKAFYRLAKKIKKNYKRLPICILRDSLYACEPVFEHCDDYQWKYLFRFKEGRIKSIANEFEKIKGIEKTNKDIQINNFTPQSCYC